MLISLQSLLTNGCTLTGTPSKSLSLSRASFGGILAVVGTKYIDELRKMVANWRSPSAHVKKHSHITHVNSLAFHHFNTDN